VVGIIVREQVFYMSDPRASQAGITELDPRRAIHVEAGDLRSLDPAAVNQQAVMNERGLSRYPRHLLDALVFQQPSGSGFGDELTFLVAHGLAVLVEHLLASDHDIDGARGPCFAAWHIDVGAGWCVRAKIFQRGTA